MLGKRWDCDTALHAMTWTLAKATESESDRIATGSRPEGKIAAVHHIDIHIDALSALLSQ